MGLLPWAAASNVLFRYYNLADGSKLGCDQPSDLFFGLAKFFLTDVHLEVEESQKSVSHLAHLGPVHAHDGAIENCVLFIAVEAELGSKGQRNVQQPLAVAFRQASTLLLMLGEEPVDVDEGWYHKLRRDVFVTTHEELNEFAHLNFTNQVLAVAEN